MDTMTGTTKTCPICKKPYYILDTRVWVYKRKNASGHQKYFCSWGCMRKWEKER